MKSWKVRGKSMRISKFLSISICMCILVSGFICFTSFVPSHSDTETIASKPVEPITKNIISSVGTLDQVEPINISSPTDWALYPFITGNGSESNPYVIENVEIHGSGVKSYESNSIPTLNLTYNGIFIDSNESFIIKNSEILNFSVGIQFGFGVNITQVSNVTIDNCGLGIYSWIHQVTLNISECHISNCRWLSTSSAYDLERFQYGGYGIWARSTKEPSIIKNNLVENCTFGIYISGTTNITQNTLINCGFFVNMQMLVVSLPYIHDDNIVNGKPLKIFWYEDNLNIRQSDVDQYGQMLFIMCDNLNFARVSITEPCSVGLFVINIRMNPMIGIDSANGTKLTSVHCANQAVGMYLYGYAVQARGLSVENCEVGYLMVRMRLCELERVSVTNCDLPIFGYDQIVNTTIQLEPGTPFHYYDEAAQSHGVLVTEISTGVHFTVGNESSRELWFQLNETGKYAIVSLNLAHPGYLGFIIDVRNYVIPGYNNLIIIALVGISVVVVFYQIQKSKKI